MKTVTAVLMMATAMATGAQAQQPQCQTQNSTTLCRMAIGRTLLADGSVREAQTMVWSYSTDATVTALSVTVDYKSGDSLAQQSCSLGPRDIKGCVLGVDLATAVAVSVEEMRRVRVARFSLGVD